VSLLTLANRKPPVAKVVQRWTLLAVRALATADAKKGRPRMRGASWSRSCLRQDWPRGGVGQGQLTTLALATHKTGDLRRKVVLSRSTRTRCASWC
jgi:hypothetical protein